MPTAELTLGVLALGGSQVALPVQELREVVQRPERLITLPACAQGLLGAVDIRGEVIPVLDLRQVLGLPQETGSGQIVVILVSAGRTLGLLADGVSGVTRVDDGRLSRISRMSDDGGPRLLLSHSFERPEDGSVVSLLDTAAILALPGIPLTDGARVDLSLSADARPDPALDTAEPTRAVLLARCRGLGLAIGIEHVHATLPSLVIRPSPLAHGPCRGVVDYADAQVPVIDLLEMLELGTMPAGPTQGLVLRLARGLVVVMLSEVVEIVRLPGDAVRALPGFAMYRPENFLGMAHTEGLGDYLLLDATTVQQQADLLALSGLNLPHQRGQASSDEESGYPSSVGETLYLTYSAGLELATPLHQVQEIISYPKDFTRLEGGVDAVVGLLSHRDVTVPLVSLARLLGRDLDVDVSSACVLLVVADAGPVGLIVQDLTAIERSQWEEEPGRARDPGPGSSGGQDDLARAVADRRLIRMQAIAGTDGADRMVPLLDLLAIAQALTSAPRRGHG